MNPSRTAIPECIDCAKCCRELVRGLPPTAEGETVHPQMAEAIALLPEKPHDDISVCGILDTETKRCTQYQ